MKTLIVAVLSLLIGAAIVRAADNIVVNQADGRFAILATSESGGVHTIKVVCNP